MGNISTVEQLASWNGQFNNTLVSDITITNTHKNSFPIQLTFPNTTFNGNNHIITIDSSVENFLGLFDVRASGIVIENLILKIDNVNGNSLLDSGWFVGPIVKNITNSCTINNCASIGPSSNGYIFNGNNKCGGIVGLIDFGTASTVNITNCYSTICSVDDSVNVGGIIGSVEGSTTSSTLNITNCFSTGSTSNTGSQNAQCSGIISRVINNTNLNINITECYTSGNFTRNAYFSGAILGYSTNLDGEQPTQVNINKCYAINYSNPIQLVGLVGDFTQVFITNSHGLAGDGSTVMGTISNVLTESSAWITSTTPYLLKVFTESPWNSSTYTTYNPTYVEFGSSSGGEGDPHIKSLDGKIYDLKLNGSIRYFDNNCSEENRFVINGFIEKGNDRYKKLDYIRKIYIKYKEIELEADMGFRGSPVKILKNTGFDIKEYILPMKKHLTIGKTSIRNCIELNVIVPNDNIYNIKLINVSSGDKNPCQIFINMRNTNNIYKYTGACINQEHGENSQINNLYDLKYIILSSYLFL